MEGIVMTAKEQFLRRVCDALATDSRPGQAGLLPARDRFGYQGAGPDPTAKFLEEVALVGGHVHPVPSHDRAADCVLDLVRGSGTKRVLLGHSPQIDRLRLRDQLLAQGVKVESSEQLSAAQSRDTFFACDLAISGVDYLIAETGSLVVLSSEGAPRSLSLLAPVHIAVVEQSQLIPDLFDLFERLLPADAQSMPSCISLITGPSKTGDIELRLVTGVHGPGELHVVLVTT
jgi:L-lactate dehydrogenase complex protein LldG